MNLKDMLHTAPQYLSSPPVPLFLSPSYNELRHSEASPSK